MRLTDRIHLVGSGEAAWALTDPLDSQVYLVTTADGHVLVDTGTGRSVESILAEMRADGLVPAQIGWILITHAHADHAGGGAAWRRALPTIRIAASAETAPWLANADEEATSVDRARSAGLYPPDYRLEPFEVDRSLGPDDTVRIADLDFRTIPSPGHAAGHLAFLVDVDGAATLFSGDALFPSGRILLQDTWDCDLQAALRSVERLADLGAERLLAGHLEPIVSAAGPHFAAALGRIARLSVPTSIG
jgi:glyoxylase-like metal-dependent hydrolase (beta-lactamase superfamily II)